MATTKAQSSILAMLDRDAVKERQKALRAMAKNDAPSFTTAELAATGNCRWIAEDVIVIGPSGVPRVETRWRRICT